MTAHGLLDLLAREEAATRDALHEFVHLRYTGASRTAIAEAAVKAESAAAGGLALADELAASTPAPSAS